jgi:hypothetical protein
MEQIKVTTGAATGTTGELKVQPGFTQPTTRPEESETFEALAGRLVNGPKVEVDEKRKDEA